MTLDPILNAPLQIQIHVLAAIVGLLLGPVVLYRRKGDTVHKKLGYTWITAMLIVATSSWFITSFGVIGPFSPIHGFALLTYWSIWHGIRQALAGDIKAHQSSLRGLYWNGLIIAGVANFIPGRTLNRILFPESPMLGWAVIALGAALILWRVMTRQRSTAGIPA